MADFVLLAFIFLLVGVVAATHDDPDVPTVKKQRLGGAYPHIAKRLGNRSCRENENGAQSQIVICRLL
uniref:hypothetical protein n=1 Tax=Yoonia sp. TaxID=2212373 RepID=UPI0040473D5D